MKFFFSLLGIVASFFMFKYRERIGDAIGEADWMRKIGGVYAVVMIFALIIFFWSVASLTGTTDILFAPLLLLFPGFRQSGDGFVEF